MAEEIAIRGSNYPAKERSPVTTILLWIFIPFYALFHYYYINKELAELGKARGTDQLGANPVMSVLAILPGFILIVPPFVSLWNTWKRHQAARQMFGVHDGIDNVPGFLLHLFIGPVGIYFLQTGQNALLEAQART